MPSFGSINLKGDLFASGICFLAQAVIRFGSSLILTRILLPEAYGVITILLSIVFTVEMLADIGVTVFVIRDQNAEEPRYLNTAWTLRLIRAFINSTIIFVWAPQIASLYHAPTLIEPLRFFSLWFALSGLESMSFPLAIRRKRARIVMYSGLTCTFISTVFSIIYCSYSRDYWGMVYGMLLNRALTTVASHYFYREFRPRLQIDRHAARDIFLLTRFTMPSSMLTLVLSQFDKVVFLRLFDLRLLGVYGLAANITGSVESLISQISQTVLYPRCAHNFRTNPGTLAVRYYTENVKLFVSILIFPALIGGAAQLIIGVLYPSQYFIAGAVLQAFMVRAGLLSLAAPAEELLIATGESRLFLIGNVLRAIWLFAGSLIGYYIYGFIGFVYGVALSNLPPLLYYWRLQHAKGLLIRRYEFYKVAFVVCVGALSYLISNLLYGVLQTIRIKI